MAKISQPAQIELEYYSGEPNDPDIHSSERWMVPPDFTNELRLAVYPDDDRVFKSSELDKLGRLQIEISGTPRAYEAFGRYLIALARLETSDDNPHDHFEDVEFAAGGTAHLIVRRRKQ
jgi:hypothetical protein